MKAESYIAAMPNMQILHQDADINYDSRYMKDSNGNHVTCTTYRIADMDIQLFKDMRQGGAQHTERMSNRLRSWKLETEMPADRDLVVVKTLCPALISDRFMIMCEYHQYKEDGEIIAIQSSRGNEYYYQKYNHLIGRCEVAENVVSMTKMKPNPEDGSCSMS